MQYRKLGDTDIAVSTVAMGCWGISGDATWGPQGETDAVAAIKAALDAGINFFDTAELYGDGYSETLLGKVLPARREEVVIGSKFAPDRRSGDEIREACEGSLRRLRTDYLDLYQIHWPRKGLPFGEAVEALESLRKQGKVRAIGIGNFGVQDLAAFLKVGHAETNQLAYNLLFRALEYEIKPTCELHTIGVVCYSSLAQGLLTGKFASANRVPEGRARTRLFSGHRPQARHREEGCEVEAFEAIDRLHAICDRIDQPLAAVALAWLIHQPGVTSVLAGARSPDQVVENARAGTLALPFELLHELTVATDPVKQKLGPNPDLWLSDPRIH